MEQILKYRNGIYGFMALWILFFHIEIRVGMATQMPFLTNFVQMGNFGVDVFMFLSGYCLALSLNRNSSTKQFYAKRFKRVVVSYLVIAVPFFLWKCYAEFSSWHFLHFVYDVTGLSFWLEGCQNAWFVEAIILFYIITPPIYHFVNQRIANAIILILGVYVLIMLAHITVPFVQRFEIATTRMPIFLIGMALACHRPQFKLPKQKVVTALFFVGSIAFLYVGRRNLAGYWWWVICASMVIPALWMLRSIMSVMPKQVNMLLSSLGCVSLEIYLIHVMTLHIFSWYQLNADIGQWMYLLLPVVTLPLSFIVPKISAKLISNDNSIKNIR